MVSQLRSLLQYLSMYELNHWFKYIIGTWASYSFGYDCFFICISSLLSSTTLEWPPRKSMQPKTDFNENIGDTVRDENELDGKEAEKDRTEEDSENGKVVKNRICWLCP
jgi:hypothetical protein